MSDTSGGETKRRGDGAVSKGLKYVGAGAALVDVPARDLTAADLEALLAAQSDMFKTVYQQDIKSAASLRAWLIKTGLYAESESE